MERLVGVTVMDRSKNLAQERSEDSAAMRECDAWLRLALARGIGPRAARMAVATAGGAENALKHDEEWWMQFLRGVPPGMLGAALREARLTDLSVERTAAQAHDASVLAFPQLPAALQCLDDAPAALWVRGAFPPPESPAVAIVGSRSATAYGRLQAARFAAELAELGVVIVSGGARGIDAEAHRAALRVGGLTVAVLGGGFDHVYPAEHASLFDAIVEAGGAVITEFPCAMSPRPEYFPRRNRIVSGLSLVVLVVEAAQRSGALLTARLAVEEQAREVACIPGPVDSPRSVGCHRAIREGWAHLVEQPRDVAELILSQRSLAIANLSCSLPSSDGSERVSVPSARALSPPPEGTDDALRGGADETARRGGKLAALSPLESLILGVIRKTSMCADEVSDRANSTSQETAVTLTALASKRLVRFDGERWRASVPP